MRLVISVAARLDLKSIARYTKTKRSASQTKAYLGMIAERFVQLRQRPKMGTAREDIAPGYRSLLAGRHLIFYRIAGNAIVVIRVLRQSMDAKLHF